MSLLERPCPVFLSLALQILLARNDSNKQPFPVISSEARNLQRRIKQKIDDAKDDINRIKRFFQLPRVSGKKIYMANKKYWQSFSEFNESEQHRKLSADEFKEDLPSVDPNAGKELDNAGTSRRDFLKYLGFSTAAAALAASCETL